MLLIGSKTKTKVQETGYWIGNGGYCWAKKFCEVWDTGLRDFVVATMAVFGVVCCPGRHSLRLMNVVKEKVHHSHDYLIFTHYGSPL